MTQQNYKKLPWRGREFWKCQVQNCPHQAWYYYSELKFDISSHRKGTSYTIESWNHTANINHRFICQEHYLKLEK